MKLDNALFHSVHSPLQQIQSPILDKASVSLHIKRDDLIDPELGGNKWRKLKYNLLQAYKLKQTTLLTFGGAWSNHIYATAAAGKRFGFNTIGIIRGEEPEQLSHTLQFARQCGMQLKFISRKKYREKHTTLYIKQLEQEFGDFYCLAEGGSNQLARKGCEELVTEINTEIDNPFNYIATACGTGCTIAGIIAMLDKKQQAIAYAALKGADFLNENIRFYLDDDKPRKNNWKLETNYHFGGYAKYNKELIKFILNFYEKHSIPLDAIYTGKMFYGLFEQIKSGAFPVGSNIVAIHTGELQGNKGIPELATLQDPLL